VAVETGDYADALRAVGLFIDQAGTSWLEVGNHGDHWAVLWDRDRQTRIEPDELAALRLVARLHRGLDRDWPAFSACQQLRAVGTLFDQTRASSFAVALESEGLRLSMRVVDKEGSRTYRFAQIEGLVAAAGSVRVNQGRVDLRSVVCYMPIAAATFSHPRSFCPSRRRR
jgi:hypothetical protein